MDEVLKKAYDGGGVIDITTVGARSGLRRRIEINFLALDDGYYITGHPGNKRDWLANMKANPGFTVHLKGDQKLDLAVLATEITDQDERADVLYRILTDGWGNEPPKAQHLLPRWVEAAPLVEFTVV
jgi:deazaflavin-dependent oxidoreductase (nitroreductase family)